MEGGGEEKCNARKVKLTPTMPFWEGGGDGGKRGGGKGVAPTWRHQSGEEENCGVEMVLISTRGR